MKKENNLKPFIVTKPKEDIGAIYEHQSDYVPQKRVPCDDKGPIINKPNIKAKTNPHPFFGKTVHMKDEYERKRMFDLMEKFQERAKILPKKIKNELPPKLQEAKQLQDEKLSLKLREREIKKLQEKNKQIKLVVLKHEPKVDNKLTFDKSIFLRVDILKKAYRID